MLSRMKLSLSLLVLISLVLSPGTSRQVRAQIPPEKPQAGGAPQALPQPADASVSGLNPATSPNIPTETPDIVAENVSGFDGSSFPLLYFTTQPITCGNGLNLTTISRSRVTGWESRDVYSLLPSASDPCPYQVVSNVISDGGFLYWVDRSGLRKLPIDAGLLDLPEVYLPQISGGGYTELILVNDLLYGLTAQDGGNPTTRIWSMQINNHASYQPIVSDAGLATQLRWDGKYLYAVWGTGHELRRYAPSDGSMLLIAHLVTSYAPFGEYTICQIGGSCNTTDFTYFVKSGQDSFIQSYDAVTGAYDFIYSATPQPGKTVTITGLTKGEKLMFGTQLDALFFFERQQTPGSSTALDFLQRMLPGGTPEAIYVRNDYASYQPKGLQRSGTFVLWKDVPIPNNDLLGVVYRLPMDAAALPVINLRITGYEITQGVQRPGNTVKLVEGRPTFLRLFVKSDGAEVPSVTARLTGISGGVELGTILPSPLLVTVTPLSGNTDLQHQFIFELPISWTTHDDLFLYPHINPFGFPLEPDYNDNLPPTAYGPFSFSPLPGLRLTLVRVGFRYNGAGYRSNDTDAIVSWLLRAYPTGISVLDRVTLDDDNVGPRVMDYNNFQACQYLDQRSKGGPDNRNLCASDYLKAMLATLQRTGALRSDTYVYASIPFTNNSNYPRGSASSQAPVANGPDLLSYGWKFEQAGYYAGHEIGHLLGREHPVEMAAICGHSASDPNYPYQYTWIGDPTHRTTAFDSGLFTPDGKRSAAHFSNRYDVMGYCSGHQKWLSDYTYDGIYTYALQNPGPAIQNRLALETANDWLTVSGAIAADGSLAEINQLRRTSDMALAPPQIPGDYTLRLLDASGSALANYLFTPITSEDIPEWMNFVETVPFVAGTRRVQVVLNSGVSLLAEQAVSANPPVVSNVALPGAASPLQGSLTLTWQASDPDGDALSYEVLYSANGGAFRLLAGGLSEKSYTFDTAGLAGGDGVFRVIASDGANTAHADSATIPVTMKTPTVHILSPVDGMQIQYGQPINLVGYAQDPQDGILQDVSNLLWSGPQGPIDVGPQVGLTGMEVAGAVDISLQATNSMGMMAESSVQIHIGDDIGDPPPSLFVASDSAAFQVANGDNATQSAAIGITNGGGPGELDWMASLDPGADWLQVDALSGTAPFTLTLSADPTGLMEDTVYNTTLTISSSNGQNIPIPVTLQTGAGLIDIGIAPGSGIRIYLPIVIRN